LVASLVHIQNLPDTDHNKINNNIPLDPINPIINQLSWTLEPSLG
jgi:hypothetical protein